MIHKFRLKSVEDISVVRKFSIFFILLAVVPFVMLTMLFFILLFSGDIENNSELLKWFFLGVGFFMILSFVVIRKNLVNIKNMSRDVKGIFNGDVPKLLTIKGTNENEIIQIARSFNEVVLRLEGTVKELKSSRDLLQDILIKISSGVSFTEDINAFLNLIMKTTVGALNAQTGMLLLTERNNPQELFLISSYGFGQQDDVKERYVTSDIDAWDWVVKQRRPLIVPYMQLSDSTQNKSADTVFKPPLLYVPLIFQNEIIGIMTIGGQGKDHNFKEDDLLISSNIASQIAMAIVNSRLSNDAQRMYVDTITALALAVEARDVYSRGHSDRVAKYAAKVAERLGLTPIEIKSINEAAQLHDVGKIGIPDDILRKPGPLDDKEWELMRQHPVIGEGIILPLRGFMSLRDPIRHHHEWLNGEGYPDCLKDNDISIIPRILAVCDSYDAMTSDRPYRKAMSKDLAIADLIKYNNIRYDPKVVDTFKSCIQEE